MKTYRQLVNAKNGKANPDGSRKTTSERGYGWRWQKARKLYLSNNALCVRCVKDGRVTPSSEVDHILPHRGNERMFWDESNWQALCKRCHSRKTGRGE